jgi:predicted permease
MDEMRLALRRLKHRPAATAASIVTLASAIAAAAVTWSLLARVLLHPLPLPDAGRIFVVESRPASSRFPLMRRDGFVYPVFPAVRDSGIFEQVAAEWSPASVLLAGTTSPPSQVVTAFATYNYFDVLGVGIRAGRSFTPDDDRRGAAPVAILTDAYWSRVFDRDPAAIGRTMTIAGKPVTIVGVAAAPFHGLGLGRPPDLYLPLHTIAAVDSPITNYFAEAAHPSSPTSGTRLIARLRPGGTTADARARLAGVSVPAAGAIDVDLTPVQTAAVPFGLRAALSQFARLLAITVGLLLLIGCATVGMLLLVRTEARRDELALCVALGASRARLAAGIACEGILLSAAGACASIPMAAWLFGGAHSFQLPGGIDIARLDLHLDVTTLVAAAVAAFAAGLVISGIAAVFGYVADARNSLRSRSGATARVTGRRARAVLLGGQVAVSLVLVAGATLFARSLAAALNLNSGLDTGQLVTTTLSLGPYGYDKLRTAGFFEDVARTLEGNPAIASLAYNVDQGGMGGKLVVDGEPRGFASMVRFVAVDESYFRTLGIGLAGGRDFSKSDGPGAPLVTIVSRSFARALAGGADALGHRITMPYFRAGQPADVMEVVGIVDDLVSDVSILEPLTMYFPMRQAEATTYRSIAARAADRTDAAERELSSAIKHAGPGVAQPAFATLEDLIVRQMAPQRFGAVVLGALGTISLLLTLLGTYVLAESMAVMRMREMGIRAALGATRRQLGAAILEESGLLVGAGLLAGLVLAWAGAGTIRAFLFQVQPLDTPTLASVATLILVLAAVVSLRPAIRAARVDLASVLREP